MITVPGAAARAALPTYVSTTGGPKADLAASDAGLQAGYFSYPKDLVKSVPTPPGLGGDIPALVQTSTAPPTPLDQNAAWIYAIESNSGMAAYAVFLRDDYPELMQGTSEYLKKNYGR